MKCTVVDAVSKMFYITEYSSPKPHLNEAVKANNNNLLSDYYVPDFVLGTLFQINPMR